MLIADAAVWIRERLESDESRAERVDKGADSGLTQSSSGSIGLLLNI